MFIENGYLVLPNYYKNKKITATTFYGLVGGNKFKPKGDYLLSVLGILKEPIDPFYTTRGAIAESALHKKLVKDGYEVKTWDKFLIGFDNFPKTPEVGGMIDMAITTPFRCVVECKSKNLTDKDKIQRFPNLEQEYQAKFYGFLSKCPKVKIIYVFFSNDQENRIRNGSLGGMENETFEFYEKDLTFDEEEMKNLISQAIQYKKTCIAENRIPLSDISDHALDLLGLKRE